MCTQEDISKTQFKYVPGLGGRIGRPPVKEFNNVNE